MPYSSQQQQQSRSFSASSSQHQSPPQSSSSSMHHHSSNLETVSVSAPIFSPDRFRIEPYFDNATELNITTSAGKTVYLPCRVHHLGDRTVSRTHTHTHTHRASCSSLNERDR